MQVSPSRMAEQAGTSSERASATAVEADRSRSHPQYLRGSACPCADSSTGDLGVCSQAHWLPTTPQSAWVQLVQPRGQPGPRETMLASIA